MTQLSLDAVLENLREAIPDALVDMQIEALRLVGRDPAVLAPGVDVRPEIREMIFEGVRGLIYTIGDTLYNNTERKSTVTKDAFLFTNEKRLPPEVARALFGLRLWRVTCPEVFQSLLLVWLRDSLGRAPQAFRRDTWELMIDDKEDLAIIPTGRKVPPPPSHPPRKRARVVKYGEFKEVTAVPPPEPGWECARAISLEELRALKKS